MNSPILEDCPCCGADSDERAFVDYEPAPNDAQAAASWSDDLPPLQGLACMNCGYVLGVVDTRDPDEIGLETSNQYRIDEELS